MGVKPGAGEGRQGLGRRLDRCGRRGICRVGQTAWLSRSKGMNLGRCRRLPCFPEPSLPWPRGLAGPKSVKGTNDSSYRSVCYHDAPHDLELICVAHSNQESHRGKEQALRGQPGVPLAASQRDDASSIGRPGAEWGKRTSCRHGEESGPWRRANNVRTQITVVRPRNSARTDVRGHLLLANAQLPHSSRER